MTKQLWEVSRNILMIMKLASGKIMEKVTKLKSRSSTAETIIKKSLK